MTFNVRGPDQPGAFDATARIAPAPRTAVSPFAHVYELQEARARRDAGQPEVALDRIPDEVWAEVDAAARLVDKLHQSGSRVAFDSDRLTGQVVASLVDPDGGRTPMSLTQAVDPASIVRSAGTDSNLGAA